MHVKKALLGLTLSMLLGSEMAAADWGDVYYCQMTNFHNLTLEGEMENYILEKFQFKLDQTKNAMVLGSTGFLKNEVYELVTGSTFPSQEYWYANDEYSITRFDKGKLMYTENTRAGGRIILANCDKF